MSIKARDISLAQHSTSSTTDNAYARSSSVFPYDLTLTSTVELDEVIVVEAALTVTSSPALTLDFTFMTHSP